MQWATGQAAALRTGRCSRLDLENLAEEVDALAKSDRRELFSRTVVVYVHLLQFEVLPDRASKLWLSSILPQTERVQRILKDSPSLRPYLADIADEVYAEARLPASIETGLPLEAFPETRSGTLFVRAGHVLEGEVAWARAIIAERKQPEIRRFRRRK